MTVHFKADARKVNGKALDEPMETVIPVTEPATPTIPTTQEKPEFLPLIQQRIGLIGIALGISAAVSALATLITVFVTRRKTAPKARYLFGAKPTRHYGYGRFRIPRLGAAYLAYTYKLPVIRYQLPEMTYKLPPIHVRLPIPSR
jgi:hypothetical protein